MHYKIQDSVVHKISSHELDVCLEDGYGRNALHLVSSYHVKCPKKCGWDDGTDIMPESSFCTVLIDEVLKRGVSLLSSKTHKGETALHNACTSGCPTAIKFLLNKGAMMLPFHGLRPANDTICTWNFKACFQQFVSNFGIGMDIKSNNGMTILHYIVGNDNTHEAISFLVENVYLVNAQDWSGSTPLHFACGDEMCSCMSGLTSVSQNERLLTPLIRATRLLLRHEADLATLLCIMMQYKTLI